MAVITYKCPNCGGGLKFDPKTQKYQCEFCLSSFTQEELKELKPQEGSQREVSGVEADYYEKPENDTLEGLKAGGKENPASEEEKGAAAASEDSGKKAVGAAVVYTCPSCGANIVTEKNTAATFCYYCHSPIVLEGQLSGNYLPDKVLPFKFDKKAAEEKFLSYTGHKKFVPKAFFSKDQIEKLSGVYYPFWVYDCEIDAELSCNADRIRTWTSGDREFTETNVYHVERAGKVSVQNLSRNALSDTDKNLVESVMPYRLKEAEPFSMGYLQGFVAQKRDIESAEVSGELKKKAQKYANRTMRKTLSEYTTTSGVVSDYRTENENFSYMLLPLWLLTYKALDGKKYYFAMNGQTGEIHGKLPVDAGKLSMVSGIIGALVFALILLILYNFA